MWGPGEQPQKAHASPARYPNTSQPVRGPCSLFSLDSFLGLVPFSRKSAELPALELALREREESEQQRGKQVRMQGGKSEPPAPGIAPLLEEGSRRGEGSCTTMGSPCAPSSPPPPLLVPPYAHLSPSAAGAGRRRSSPPGSSQHLGQASQAGSTDNTAAGERGLGGSPWQPQSRGGAAASEVPEELCFWPPGTGAHTPQTPAQAGSFLRGLLSLPTTAERQRGKSRRQQPTAMRKKRERSRR